MGVMHSTFTLERHYPATVERVFDAWANPDARKRWMAQGAEHSQDFVLGGVETVRGVDGEGRILIYEARYVEIVPGERILTTSTLHTEDRLSTVSVTSVEFQAEGSGTRVVLTEHGIYLPGQEQPLWREQGTAQQLDTLAAEFHAATEEQEI
ncbi:SRPBCC family protein [Psychromicrobium xiongbiense]|uniref:SRPBCC family protein n=1 Tax=Psychromicrobium xiongbiense TaxID=3051184 RepID=UPI0025555FD1|nr:SRPBCC family protein [Psychromicrobium sp. YIM S02556]